MESLHQKSVGNYLQRKSLPSGGMVVAKIRNLIRTYGLLLKVVKVAGYSEMLIGIRNLRRVVGQLWSVISRGRYFVERTSEPPVGTVCFVLGNGPSLAMDLKDGIDILSTGDVVCVNAFAETDLYEKIQPKYYVLADPGYWTTAGPENYVASRKSMFDQILSKTSWPLIIYVPIAAKNLFEATFSRAQNIRLSFYSATPLQGTKEILNILYDLGLGMPQPQNVLIPALFLPLRLGYKKIILLGADHSWHETLVVDDANRVCVRHPHFYDTDAKLRPFGMGVMEGHGEKLFTMDAAFYAFAKMFEGYWKLEEYAKYLGAQVYNASSVTFIDAFKRKPIADLLVELADDARKDR